MVGGFCDAKNLPHSACFPDDPSPVMLMNRSSVKTRNNFPFLGSCHISWFGKASPGSQGKPAYTSLVGKRTS